MITFDVAITVKARPPIRFISERINVAESVSFSYTKQNGGGYTLIPMFADTQFVILRADRAVTLRFNGQTNAGLPLNAGGIAIIKGTDCSAVLIDNSSGSDATIEGLVIGNGEFLGGGSVHDYVQDTDPRLDADKIIVFGDRWWDTSTKTIYVTNADNTGWDSWSGVFGP